MIVWDKVTVKIRTTIILRNISFSIEKGKSLGIKGANGSGKTVLAKALCGIIPANGNIKTINPDSIHFLSFQSSFRLKNGFSPYRQQRWNNIDTESVPTVAEEIGFQRNQKDLEPLLEKFNFRSFLYMPVISLSNGEQRKMELIRALAKKPELLIIESAYNGLDQPSREFLNEMLNQLIEDKQSMVITGVKPEDFPSALDSFIELPNINNEKHPAFEMPKWPDYPGNEIISIENLSLEMNDQKILKNISWKVQKGEKWILSGGNGSGKTSLLNMIFADNPKAYNQSIRLFGKAKGSGESIWDIKVNTGFVSPELQQYFPKGLKTIDVVCSGLFDSEGLYIKPSGFHQKLARQWLALTQNISLAEKPFYQLSASQQRMALIVRALIKTPPLLLLDEPFQGLDADNLFLFKQLLNKIAIDPNCTIVFVSHFRDEIPDNFTKEIRLNNGEIELSGLK